MIFQILSAAAVAGMIMASTSCAQKETAPAQNADVFVVTGGRGPWLGVSIEDMSARLARRMNVKTEKGALVNSVSDDSPAAKAGIREDDIIISFNGKTIEDASDLSRAVAKSETGKAVDCVVMRKDGKKTLQVTPAPRPGSDFAWAPRAPMALARPGHVRLIQGGVLGLEVMDLNRQLAEYFEIPGGRGVLVSEVDKEGPGAKAGLKAGDVIVSMGANDVDDVDDIHWALSDRAEGDTVAVGYVRKGARRSAVVTVDKSSGPKVYGFRPGRAPDFDFDLDIDLERLREELDELKGDELQGSEHLKKEHQQQLMKEAEKAQKQVKRVQREVERVQKEAESLAREAAREAQRAAREVSRAMRARTI
jgi:membrane-associated protease RseP (regulator of RpoE activity)